jgi:predicted nucleotidyltransferase
MFEAIPSETADVPLAEVLARLARHPAVEGVLALGSTGTDKAGPQSDYDLLVIVSDMPVPLHVILTRVDGRLTDVLLARSELVARMAAGGFEPASRYEGLLAEHLKAGRVVHDRDGRLAQARAALAGRDWRAVPDDREAYDYAVHGINFNYQHNCRYAAHPGREHRTALEIRLHYSLEQVIFGYFRVRRLPWGGEMAAIGYWQAHDPAYLALFEAYHAAASLDARLALYAQLAGGALAPVGGLWPPDAVNVLLEGGDWQMEDVPAAAAFWHSLVR